MFLQYVSKDSEYLDQSKLGHEPAVGHRAKRAKAASIGIMSNLREVIVIQIQSIVSNSGHCVLAKTEETVGSRRTAAKEEVLGKLT